MRQPDGTVIDGHHVVDFPAPAVAVVPVGDDGRILLIEHYRFITETTGWEVPAGRFDEGENVESAGARELMEETGHAAGEIKFLGKFFPCNGVSNLTFNVCIAKKLVRKSEIQDTNEVIRIGWFTRPQVEEMLRSNQIRDGLSLTALLWFLFTV